MDDKYYVISGKELRKLLNAKVKLDALESTGVDNWEWYGEALENIEQDEWSEEEVDNAYEEVK